MWTAGFSHRLLRGDRTKIFPLFRLYLSSSPAITIAPRKGRQAIRRILKLLSSRCGDATLQPELAGALETLEADPCFLSSSQAASLVSAVADPLISFDFYRFLRSSGGASLRPDSSLFCSLLGSQLRSASPQTFRIRFYLGEMKKHGALPTFEEFKALMGSILSLNPSLAGRFLDEVIQTLGADSAIFAAAIVVYAEEGLVDEAFGLAERARKEVERPPSVELYSSLLVLHRYRGDAKAAMEVFLEMKEGSVVPNEESYGVLLETLSAAGWMKLCWASLLEMKARGALKLCEKTGQNLMRAFLQRGMAREAEWLFREGLLSEKESYALFAELMSEKKMHAAALELLKTTPHLVSCAETLLRVCGRMGLVQEAESIFEQVKEDPALLPSMILVYARAGMRSSAERAWSRLEASEGGLTGDACLRMMSMYAEMGLLRRLEKAFDRWKSSGIPLNADGYAVLVDAYAKAGKLGMARGCLSEMARISGLRPTAGMRSRIAEGYLRAGLPAPAGEIRVSGLIR